MVALKHDLNCVDTNGWREILESKATRTIIGIAIALIFLVISARFLKGLSMLIAMEKQCLCFLRLKAEAIEASLASVLFWFKSGKAMATKATSIYFPNSRWKVESGFNLCNDRLLDTRVLGVFLTAFLLGLGINEGP